MVLFTIIMLAAWPQADLLTEARAAYGSRQFGRAEQLFIEALHTIPEGDERLRATTLANLGSVYASQEEFPKAERAYLEALTIYQRLQDKNASALVLHYLGIVYSCQQRDEEALRLLTRALASAKSPPAADVEIIAQIVNGLGVVYYRRGKYVQAERFFKDVLQMIAGLEVKFDTGGVLNDLGSVYVHQRKFKKAEELLSRALQIRETEVGPSHPDLVAILSMLGALYLEANKYGQAESEYHRALKILEPHRSDFAPTIARILDGLSITYAKAGRKAESDAALAQAAEIARNNLGKEPLMATILDDYSVMLKKQGKTKEAEELRLQVKRTRAGESLIVNAHSLIR